MFKVWSKLYNENEIKTRYITTTSSHWNSLDKRGQTWLENGDISIIFGAFFILEKKKWTGNSKWTETSPIRNVQPQIKQKSLTPSFCPPKNVTLRRTHTQGYVDTPRSSRCPGQRDRRSWRERGAGGGTAEDGWAPRAVKLPCVEACCTICVETINATDHCCRRSAHTQPGPQDSRGRVQATLYFLMKTETGSEQFSDMLWGILLLLRFPPQNYLMLA